MKKGHGQGFYKQMFWGVCTKKSPLWLGLQRRKGTEASMSGEGV